MQGQVRVEYSKGHPSESVQKRPQSGQPRNKQFVCLGYFGCVSGVGLGSWALEVEIDWIDVPLQTTRGINGVEIRTAREPTKFSLAMVFEFRHLPPLEGSIHWYCLIMWSQIGPKLMRGRSKSTGSILPVEDHL